MRHPMVLMVLGAVGVLVALTAAAPAAAAGAPGDMVGPRFSGPVRAGQTGMSAPPAEVPAEGEPPAAGTDAKETEKKPESRPVGIDLEQLKTMLAEYEQALYATEQEKIAKLISGGVTPHVDELLAKLKAEKTPPVELVRLLGFAHAEEANRTLVGLLDSPDAAVRSAAAFSLGVAGDPKAVDRLMRLLDDKDDKVAAQAAVALGRTKDPRAYAAIEKRLGSKEPLRRLSAIKALGLLGDKRAVARLEERLRTSDDPLDTCAVLDALNLIAGDNLFRIIEQFERVAGVLQKHGTGQQTQLAQAAITDALSRFIKQVEDQSQQQGGGQGRGQRRQTSAGRMPGQSAGSASGGQGGATPAGESHNNPAPQVDSTFADTRATAGVVWGNLPPAVQEEITAALKQELPERYKHLLKVYYKILAEGR